MGQQGFAMKTRIILAMGIGIAWCSAASAAEPLTPVRLGLIDAVIASCSAAMPEDSGAYKTLKVSLIGKPSDRTLDAMKGTPEYRQAFTQMRLVVAELSPSFLRQSCLDAIGRRGRGNGR
jgi:hypothetical protein